MNGKAYKSLKWIWLIGHCAMPFLAVWYILQVPVQEMIPALLLKLWPAVLTFCMVFWLIFEALLLMYRFPLKIRDALILVGVFVLQYAAMFWGSGSASYAAFTSIACTLLAMGVCAALLTVKTVAAMDSTMKWAAALIIALLFLPPVMFMPLLLFGLREMPPIAKIANTAFMLNAVGVGVRELVGLTVFGKPDDQKAAFDAEWERWAAPTIILLILSAVGALTMGGILNAVK
ncbi:MAG: hypothetical protein AB7T27_11145 [Kiritimatiellia bacterium]